jgi:hypothetical protein
MWACDLGTHVHIGMMETSRVPCRGTSAPALHLRTQSVMGNGQLLVVQQECVGMMSSQGAHMTRIVISHPTMIGVQGGWKPFKTPLTQGVTPPHLAEIPGTH